MKKSTAGMLLAFLLWPLLTLAQIDVSFPVSRAVFQRSTANVATIRITGFYRTAISRVQARMVARAAGQGTTTDWVVIQNNVQGGVFAGDLTVQGGWYDLQVQGLDGNNQPVGDTRTVDRVGVGEVFIAAGQSNTMGVRRNVPPANDDRVNCVQAYAPDQAAPVEPPFPVFRQMNGVDIAPSGVGTWCWGILGDRLAQRLNVPILFLNAGFGGTSASNWLESSQGVQAYNGYSSLPFPFGQPYANLRIALNVYGNMLGVRSVLWHQGEADNSGNTGASQYANALRETINRSRQDCGKNVVWVVARASYDNDRRANPAVIAGQDMTIATTGNVYAGPNTDGIDIPRNGSYTAEDNVHFTNDGLNQVADAWSASLTDSFFAGSTPQAAAPAPTLSVACAGNQLTLSVNGSPTSVVWNTGDAGPVITKGQGVYQAKVKDGLGNTHYTSFAQVSAGVFADPSGPTTFCQGGAVSLTSNYQNNITWSTGVSTRSIAVSDPGNYFVRFRDVSGCDFTSDVIRVTVNPLPAVPVIASDKSTTFCQGETASLTASPAAVYNWSTGEQSRSITVKSTGSYTLSVTDQNGCTSPGSAAVAVKVNPLPITPTITAGGPTTFCADQQVILTATADVAYNWTSGQTTQSVTLNQSGNFSIQTKNEFGCLSNPSNTINLKVNALPPAPTLVANGRTTFCEGDRVTLTATTPFKPIWTTSDTVQTITVRQSGTYTVRAQDQNGCFSTNAPAIVVAAKPVPSTPSVVQVGTYTLEAMGSVMGDVYRWQRNSDSLAVQRAVIKANQSGTYSVRASIRYNTDLICFSAYSTPITFVAETANGGLSVYPNPSPTREVTLETLNNLIDATVTVYTLSGQEVYTTAVPVFDERKRLSLVNVSAGSYLVEVRSADFRVVKRILVGL